MDKDVAPELIENVNKAFEKNCIKDGTMQAMTRKLEEGAASYSDAYRYAESVGNARAQAFKSEINSSVLPDGRMYYNIGNRLLNDSLGTDHDMVADYAAKVQEIYNKEAGISLKAQKADKDESRIKGFVDRLDSEEDYDKVSWILDEPVKVHAMSVVDDTIKKNAEFQGKAGVKATVIRDAKSDCCGWCTDLAGDYVYPQVPNEVFARHDNCRCGLEYEGRKLSAYESGGKSHSFRDLGEREERIVTANRNAIEEQNRRIHYGKKEYFERDRSTVIARSVKNMPDNNIYVEDSVTIAPRKLRWINDGISESKQILGISDTCKIPIIIVDDENMLAAYNPRTDIMFISSRMSDENTVLKLQQSFAAADNINSTTVHELIHWQDAEEYRTTIGAINSAEPLSDYTIYQRERAIDMLEKSGIDLGDMNQIREISQYAYEKAIVNAYEEVYDEYRVSVLLGK